MKKTKANKERCKFCGKDTSGLDFMAFDPNAREYYHICVECLKKLNNGGGKKCTPNP